MENSNPQRGKRPASSDSSASKQGPKRRRRPGPASRALKAFYQQQRQEAGRSKKLRPAAPSAATSSSSSTSSSSASSSYEHKYDEGDGRSGGGRGPGVSGGSFEFKSQDFEDLVTPRVDHLSSASALGLASVPCVAPKKCRPKGPIESPIDYYVNVPDTSRIDLTASAI
jgi:hypothetical protein